MDTEQENIAQRFPAKPPKVEVHCFNIPQEMKDRPQWVAWKYDPKPGRPGEWTKPPYCANARDRRASSTNRETWVSFIEASNALDNGGGFDGIGFVFSPEDPCVGIDLDHCFENGKIKPWAQDIVDRFPGAYIEITPSGEGLHLIIKGKLPNGGGRRGPVEWYDQGRYFTVTGHALPCSSMIIKNQQEALEKFLTELSEAGKTPEQIPAQEGSWLTDSEVIERASASKSGEKFKRLWAGDSTDYPSPSEADSALSMFLAFWCNRNTTQMDRLFRQSGLYRSKWDEKHGAKTYGDTTLERAAALTTETFTPAREKAPIEIPARTRDPLTLMRTGQDLQDDHSTTEWIVEKIIAEQSITTLSGKGGGGKTWTTLGLADAVSRGVPFMGLKTKQAPVYYQDFENPYSMLCDRARKLDIKTVLFWHQSFTPPPPKIDSGDFDIYKQLPPGMIIFDTLRSAQSKDENNSQDMAFIMGRLKELRDLGFTVLILHHTPKSNERTYKGSTAIIDLCDQALGLYRVKSGTSNEIVDDDDNDEEDKVFRLGTKDKTRYEPFHIFLRLDPELGFVPAPEPDTDTLELMQAVLCGEGRINQSRLFEKCRESLGMRSKKRFINLLRRGDGKYWSVTREKSEVLYASL